VEAIEFALLGRGKEGVALACGVPEDSPPGSFESRTATLLLAGRVPRMPRC
jgi:hypothetical protein